MLHICVLMYGWTVGRVEVALETLRTSKGLYERLINDDNPFIGLEVLTARTFSIRHPHPLTL